MLKQSCAALLAASLALSPIGAAPARADGEDLAKVLAGIAGLYIVGRAIERNRDDDKETKADHRWSGHDRRDDNGRDRHDRRGDADKDRDGWSRHDRWDRGDRPPYGNAWGYRARTLPSSCVRRVEGRSGTVYGYLADCLERSMPRGIRLPAHCRFDVRSGGREIDFYRSSCLADAGFRVAWGS